MVVASNPDRASHSAAPTPYLGLWGAGVVSPPPATVRALPQQAVAGLVFSGSGSGSGR